MCERDRKQRHMSDLFLCLRRSKRWLVKVCTNGVNDLQVLLNVFRSLLFGSRVDQFLQERSCGSNKHQQGAAEAESNANR